MLWWLAIFSVAEMLLICLIVAAVEAAAVSLAMMAAFHRYSMILLVLAMIEVSYRVTGVDHTLSSMQYS